MTLHAPYEKALMALSLQTPTHVIGCNRKMWRILDVQVSKIAKFGFSMSLMHMKIRA
jgi:hypothetical protein